MLYNVLDAIDIDNNKLLSDLVMDWYCILQIHYLHTRNYVKTLIFLKKKNKTPTIIQFRSEYMIGYLIKTLLT